MAENSYVCKFLYDNDRNSIFQIPSQLVERYGEFLPSEATLRIDQSKSWKVKIDKFRGHYFFTDGWKQFAEEVEMETRDYLMFKDVGLFEFRVEPEENDDHNAINRLNFAKNSSDVQEGTSGILKHCGFTRKVKRSSAYRLKIPKRYSVAVGMAPTRNMKLRDAAGKVWTVHVTHSCGQFSLSAGWNDFLTGNKVVLGSRLSFEFISRNIIDVRVVKMGNDATQGFKFLRKACKYVVDAPHKTIVAPEKTGWEEVERRLRFSKELKMHHAFTLVIPVYFATEVGIDKTKEIILQYEGRKWTVDVTERGGRFSLSRGWHDFLIGTKMVVDSVISFVSATGSTIEVQLVRRGPDERALFNFVEKKEGRFELCHSFDFTSDLTREPEKFHSAINIENEDHVVGHENGSRASNDHAQNDEDEDGFTDGEDAYCVERAWRFSLELKKRHVYRLGIPKQFVVGTGIVTMTTIILKNSEGKEWLVRLTDKNCGQFSMGSGWYNFLVDNKVVVGSTMSFEFVSGTKNIIEAQVVKIGTNKEELFEFVKRRRGKEVLVSPVRSDHESYDSPYEPAQTNEDDNGLADREEAYHVGRRWSFTQELMEKNVDILVIPTEFAVGTGMSRKTHITLKDVHGREWRVRVTDKSCGIFSMTDGWYDFLVGNNVVVGSIMSFEFVSGSDATIETRMVKIGADKKELFEFVKKHQGREVSVSPFRNEHATYEIPYDNAQNNEGKVGFTDRAEAYHVGRSWRFTQVLKKDNVYGLVIPGDFASGTRISCKSTIKLKDQEGREWMIRVTSKNIGVFALTAGWYDFLVLNNVRIGSIMSFKFISGLDYTIEAQVIKIGEKDLFEFVRRQRGRDVIVLPTGSDHATEDTPDDFAQDSEDEDSFNDREEYSRVGRRWRFTEELRENNVYKLVIPTEFSLGTGMAPNTNITLKDVQGREWLVRVITEKISGQFVLRAGWNEFLVANKVLVGTIMSFELICASDITIEARVVKVGTNKQELFEFVKRQGEKEHLVSCTRSDATENKSSIPKASGESKKSGAGKRFRFSKEVKKHHAYTLDIPKYVAIKTGIARQKQLMLVDAEGKKWPVQVLKRDYYRFSSGWYEFLIGNRVVIGSTLSFEMRSANRILVQVDKEGTNRLALFNSLIREEGKLVLPESNQASDLATEPGNSDEASDHAQVPTNTHEASDQAGVPTNLPVDVKIGNDHFSEAENDLSVDRTWSFSKKLMKSHKYKLDLPKDFAMVIGEAESGEVQLQIRRGKKWPVQVKYNKSRNYYWMGSGWTDFLVGSKVHVGSTVSLDWSPNRSVIGVQLTDSGNKHKELFVKGSVGRPSSS